MIPFRRRRAAPARVATARVAPVLLALALLAPPAAAAAEAPAASEQSALEQRIERGQDVARGRAVLADGHVDVGPRFLDGRWTLMVHDDKAKSGGGRSVWRATDRTVLRVADAAVREAPDDPAYGFLRAQPGADLFVIPQTQDPEVVWLGWNTQDPTVMERIDRGVTMSLDGVEGPGSLIVYLQSGSFDAPEVLWDSAGRSRAIWVDVNTHTHANWVFSAPGVYLARVRIEADLIDGRTVTDTRELRFAVGSRTDPDEAFTAAWRGGATAADSGAADADPGAADADGGAADADGGAADADDGADDGSPLPAIVLVVLAVVLVAGLVSVLTRGASAKRSARNGPDSPTSASSPPSEGGRTTEVGR